jgi:hypothetical protein
VPGFIKRSSQGLIIGKAQVAPDPPDGDFHDVCFCVENGWTGANIRYPGE